MSQEIALIMALPNESKGLFEAEGIEVHYSGIGKINAAFKAFEVIQKTGCTTLLNLGTAGSTHFNAHELIEVSQFVQRDMDVSPLGFEIGVTPMDQHFPVLLSWNRSLNICRKGFAGQVTVLKPACRKSRVIWLIWKAMLWQKSVKTWCSPDFSQIYQ